MVSMIVFPKEILNRPWFSDITVRSLYLHLYFAAWKQFLVENQGSPKLAILHTSQNQLAKEIQQSRQQIRRDLMILKESHDIKLENVNQSSLITICYLAMYWNRKPTHNQPSNQVDNQLSTNQECTKYIDKNLTKKVSCVKQKPTHNQPSNQVDNQLSTKEMVTEIVQSDEKMVDQDSKESIRQVIDCLNSLAGTRYTYRNKLFNKLILGRLHDGFTVEDLQTVIKKKCDDWIGTEWEKYLTPETLFRPSKFESYLNARIIKNEESGGMVF